MTAELIHGTTGSRRALRLDEAFEQLLAHHRLRLSPILMRGASSTSDSERTRDVPAEHIADSSPAGSDGYLPRPLFVISARSTGAPYRPRRCRRRLSGTRR